MPWPPETEAEKHAVHRRQLAAAPSLAIIESFAPPPKPAPALEPDAWARQLALKAEALAFIETFRPWWVDPPSKP